MKTLTIQRSKWARGGKSGLSALLNAQGAMCCLGFYARALGATKDQILGVPAPHCLVKKLSGDSPGLAKQWMKKFNGLVKYSKEPQATELAGEMMRLNDLEGSEEIRESRLTKLFIKIGWKLKFIE